jgi:hypothetical protein
MQRKSPENREISAATFDAVRYARSVLLASTSTDNKNKRFIYLSLSKALSAAYGRA